MSELYAKFSLSLTEPFAYGGYSVFAYPNSNSYTFASIDGQPFFIHSFTAKGSSSDDIYHDGSVNGSIYVPPINGNPSATYPVNTSFGVDVQKVYYPAGYTPDPSFLPYDHDAPQNIAASVGTSGGNVSLGVGVQPTYTGEYQIIADNTDPSAQIKDFEAPAQNIPIVLSGYGTLTASVTIPGYIWVDMGVAPSQSVIASISGTPNIVEGDNASRQAVYTISLDHSSADAVTVTYATADGTATAGSDYQLVSGSHTFAAGETTWSFPVNILSDLVKEQDESFRVLVSSAFSISSSTNASVDPAHSYVDTTITDGALPPQAQDAIGQISKVFNQTYDLIKVLGSLQKGNPIVDQDLSTVKSTVGNAVKAISLATAVTGPLAQFDTDITQAYNTIDPNTQAQKEWAAYRDLDVSIGNNALKFAFTTAMSIYVASPAIAGAELYASLILLDTTVAAGLVITAPAVGAAIAAIVAGAAISAAYDSFLAPVVKSGLQKNYEQAIPQPFDHTVPPLGSNPNPSTHDGDVQVASVGTVVHDVSSAGGVVFALYDALLHRAPDTAGLQSWAAALNSGTSLHDVTTAMLASTEVQSHLNAASNAGYVAQVYETVLHRQADAAGLQSWTAALDSGAISRADLVLTASLSPEHVASIQPALDAGVLVPDQNAVAVAKLYYATLGRAPDAAGLQAYTAALENGSTSLHDIAQSALSSTEYAAHVGTDTTSATASAYVESVYEQVLSRHSDAAGLQSWTDALAHGTAPTSVAIAAVGSSEYQGQYAGQSNGAYVEGLYEHLFGRQGDAAGVQSWTSALDSHATTRVDLANAFVNSAEFQAHFGVQAGVVSSGTSGGPSDAAFVESLYENALGRHADAGGLQGWTDALAHGTSRADVAVAIAEGAEAQQHLAAQIQQSYHVA